MSKNTNLRKITNYLTADNNTLSSNVSQTITGSLTVTGNLTAQQFIVSSSVTYLTESFASGSHKFGDSSDDNHNFTGSLVVSGSANPLRVGSNLLFVSSSGNVGIGTTTPSDFIDATLGLAIIAPSGRSGLSLGSTQGTADEILGRLSFTNTNSSNAGGKRLSYISGIRGTTNNSAYIEFGTANDGLGTQRMVISQTGNVGIGTSSPSNILHVAQSNTGNIGIAIQNINASYNSQIRFLNAAGTEKAAVTYIQSSSALRFNNNTYDALEITSGGNVVIQNNKIYGTGEYLGAIWNSNGGNTTWTIGDTPANQISWNLRVNTSAAKSGGGSWGDSSDGRLKKDIQPIQNALEEINKLNPVTFEWINPEEHNNQYNIGGFIAQEIKEIFPQFINEINAEGKDKDIVGENEVVYGLTLPFKFDAYLVKAIQELSDKNTALEEILQRNNIV